MSSKPLAVDLFCGIGGWTEGLIAEGYEPIGFDIERHVYGTHAYPAQLVLQDVRTLHGSQIKEAALIVASPPCQEYSYMAMPWTRAKEKAKAIRADETGAMITDLNALFNACSRIQREASEAAGHHIPMVVENVRGAIPWVGCSRWNFGSYHLWGDVPALMPIARGRKNSGGSWFSVANNSTSGLNNNPVSVPGGYKSIGMNWSDQTKRGQDFTRIAGKQAMEGIKGIPHRTNGHWINPAEHEGVKHHGSGGVWFDTGPASMSSKFTGRKAASAMIAKIPFPLAKWVASVYHPRNESASIYHW